MSKAPLKKPKPLSLEVRVAVALTVLVAIGLFITKFIAYRWTGSQAIFSEAMESIVNVMASVILLFVVRLATKPADKEHPYGHGKIEYLSAAVEGGLIAFAAFLIIVEALRALLEHRPLQELNLGLLLLAGTAVVNVVMGFYLNRLGLKKGSAALEASGKHLMADFWTTAGVLAGLGVVAVTKVFWLDGLIAIAVSVHLIREGYGLVRKAIGGLLDEGQTSVLKEIQKLINRHKLEGIIQVHHLRVMRSGPYHHIDAHVVVPEFWTVEEAHDSTNEYEKMLFKNYKFSGELHFHMDPCRKLYCQYCNLKECPVRQEPFRQYREMSLEELTNFEEPEEITDQLPNQ